MRCPYCNHEFQMTWRRYFKSPMGRHICPSCQQKSYFPLTMTSWLRVSVFVGIGAVPFCLLIHHFFAGDFWLPGGIIGGLLIAIPLDKFYDGKYRKLKKY